MRLDHLAIASGTLEDGVSAVEAALGVTIGPGGRHPRMGTWNRLLSLGPDEYLEVVAIDPEAPHPGRPRWFALDRFAGPPRITNWICRCDDLAAEALPGAGEVLDFTRGDYRWQMAVPPDGELPLDGLQPAQIQWHSADPAPTLTDVGCRLTRLTLVHPDADTLRNRLAGLEDPRIEVLAGETPTIRAEIDTPNGPRTLA